MEEQFILRVPPSVAERIDRLLSENASSSSSEDKSLDLSFSEDGRTGTFVIDIGQMIMVREEGDNILDVVEYRHGLTPSMRDARRRRFRREPDLNPELVRRVAKDLINIMAGGTAETAGVEVVEQEEDGEGNARGANKKEVPKPAEKPDVREAGAIGGEPERSDSEESDDSI